MSIFLIISVSFLILSNAPITAQIDVQIDTSKNNSINEIYVDPSIKLNTNRIYDLEIITEKIENGEYRQFFNRVIEELKLKGNLNAKDIKSIAEEFEFTNDWFIRAGIVIGNAHSCRPHDSPLSAGGIPFLFRPIFQGCSWRGPGLYAIWDCSDEYMISFNGINIDINIMVNAMNIDYHHKGIAILQFGFWFANQGLYDFQSMIWGHHLRMRFFSPFIIINPDN